MSINQTLRCVACTLLALFALLTIQIKGVQAQGADGDSTAGVQVEQAAGGAAADAAGGLSSDPGVISQGKELFNNNCSQCHAVNKKVVGPQLSDVYKRRPVPWLINFIKYPQKTIESGDEYAVKLYAEYKSAGYMPNHDFFKDADIVAILSYVQEETNNPTVEVKDVGGSGQVSTAEKSPISKELLYAIIVVLTGLIVVAVLALGVLITALQKYLHKERDLSEDDQELLNEKVFDFWGIIKSPGVSALIGFVFFAIVFKTVITGLFTIGVQQGYAPNQPIKFSHKLHAGTYEIDCKYCHTGAARGKSAGIPSANICMNCHNEIRNSSPEIQKIYAHIEENKPIQWVRVHNLPDLSYFNHSQHVIAGGVECQTCHGEIQEMEVVQQVSLLTMGWCVSCHRQTEVNTKDNPYYDQIVKIHAAKTKTPLRVEDIGGLECSKCHY